MIETLYVEHEVANHPQVLEIVQRYPGARVIPCSRYTEIFNRKAQNFRLQKQKPALILAKKHGARVLKAPDNYGIGGQQNYYFSHMLNCLYDCRYCFLQGMYRSAHYVLFVNYEDFKKDIIHTLQTQPQQTLHFFSGYDCDSLALEPVTGFVNDFIPLFQDQPRALLELRTKSTQIRTLLDREPLSNVVVAYSFTPEDIADALEHKAPAVQRRIDALQRLQEHGWPVGLRFDPLIYCSDYQDHYHSLFENIFTNLTIDTIHSVSLGSFRLPSQFHKTLTRLYPEEKLFASPLQEEAGMVSYRQELNREMMSFCTSEILKYIPQTIFYPCHD